MLNNNSFNLITALSNKSEALTVYDKYIQDAQEAGSQECVQLWQEFKQQDEQAVQRLKERVEMLVKGGKL